MNLFVVGLNHKTAPIEIREKFYLTSLQQELLLSELKSNPAVIEAFIFSTCNRTEVYVHLIHQQLQLEWLFELIAHIKKISFSKELIKYFYVHERQDAVKHLFKVVTGLDSLVIGEKQILGQTKTAFELARGKGMLSKHFNILTNIALRVGKKAQTETDICLGGSSISWAAVTKAEKLLGNLEDKSVLILGAGEMSKLALEQIAQKPFKQFFIMNRTQANAQILTEKYGGIPVGFCDIKDIFGQVDVCICAVDAPHYIIDLEIVEKIQPKHPGQKIILIDISMPRNIDPQVSKLDYIQLLSIDDLDRAIEENMKKRMDAVNDVENIISEKLNYFYDKLSKLNEPNSLDLHISNKPNQGAHFNNFN